MWWGCKTFKRAANWRRSSQRGGYGVDELAGLVENIRGEVGQTVELLPAVGHVAQKHPHVVVGIRALDAKERRHAGKGRRW